MSQREATRIQLFPDIIGVISILTVVDGVWANPISACLAINSAQRLVYLDINIHPVAERLILHAAMLPNTQLRATQGMLKISQGLLVVKWVNVLRVIIIGVIVIGVVMVEVMMIIFLDVSEENTVVTLLGIDILLASIAA